MLRAFANASAGSSSNAGRVRNSALAVFAALALLLFGATGARAATPIDSYGYLTSFHAAPGGIFAGTNGGNNIAVDSAGNIFVAYFDQTIEVFSPDAVAGGVPLETIDFHGAPIGGEEITLPLQIAIDPSDDSLLMQTHSGHIHRLLSDGQPTPTYTVDPTFAFSFPSEGFSALAVSPSSHDVVASQGSETAWTDSTGSVLRTIPGGSKSLAPDGSGGFYAIAGSLAHYAADGSQLQDLPLPSGFQAVNVATNAQSGEVVALVSGQGQFYLQGYSSAGEPTFLSRLRTDTFNQPVGEPNGLAWDPVTNRIYYLTQDEAVHVFVPAQAPGVDAPVTSEVTGTSAKIEVGIAPAGSTKLRIELCPVAPAYASCSKFPLSNPEDPGNPWQRIVEEEGLTGAPTTVTVTPSNLMPDTTYQVRAWAANETAGTETTSEVVSFKAPLIPPGVVTGPALQTTDTQAELSGEIDTYGVATTYHFEYGLTTSYGLRAPAGPDAIAGSGREPRTFTQHISGLQPGTTYHYRLVAESSAGARQGADRTFTTQGVDEVAPGRAYEQVSPVDKGGAAITSVKDMQIPPDGNHMVIPTSSAPEGGTGSMIFNHFVVHREGDGWSDWTQTDPPFGATLGTFETSTLAVSDDFEHAFVVSTRALASGAVAGDANLYVHDLITGAYTFVGRSAPENLLYLAGVQISPQMFVSGAPNFEWVIFHAPSLRSDVPNLAMYKWSRSGGLTLLSQMPDGSVPPVGVWPSGNYVFTERQASTEGDVAYFALRVGGSLAEAPVYRRAAGATTPISVSQIAGDSPTPQPGLLDGVSADGRYAVFQSPSRLTEDTPAFSDANAIYRYDSQDASLQYIGLTGENQQEVFQVSEAADRILYKGGNGQGEGGLLTLWTEGGTQQIGTAEMSNTARLSPNGRYVLHIEERQTTQDIFESGSGLLGTFYLYDSVTGEDSCVSCVPGGGPGKNLAYVWYGRGLGNQLSQVVTDNGMAFFDTPEKLLAADHNNRRDVYVFQHGQVTLISPADGNFQARFVGASANGRDVFFTTDEGLVGQDTDGAVDMYDARVGGGFASQNPPPPPVSCIRAECGPLATGPGSSAGIGSLVQGSTSSPRARISVAHVTKLQKGLKVRVQVNQPGRIRIGGSGVVATSRRVSHPGSYVLTVPFTRKARERIGNGTATKVALKARLIAASTSATTKFNHTFGK
jgi:hypothetical protein